MENNRFNIITPETDEKKKHGLSVKSANWFFLISILMIIFLSGEIPLPLPKEVDDLPVYILVVVLAFVLCRMEKVSLRESFCFNRTKPLTLVIAILVCIGMNPFVQLLGSLTEFLLPEFLKKGSSLSTSPLWLKMIGSAVIPGFFEEFIMRGGVQGSYQRTGRIRAAVLLSAFLFAIMHGNITQLVYGFAGGVIIGLVFLLSDSIWPVVLIHFINNALSVICKHLRMLYGNDFIKENFYPLDMDMYTTKNAVITAALGLAGLVLVIFLIRKLASYEGAEDKLKAFLEGGGGDEKLVTLPLILAIVLILALSVMIILSKMKA